MTTYSTGEERRESLAGHGDDIVVIRHRYKKTQRAGGGWVNRSMLTSLMVVSLLLLLVLYASSSASAQNAKLVSINSAAVLPMQRPASPAPIALLMPDGMSTSDPGVVAWLESAQEDGILIDTLTDTQFLALGTNSNRYRGLILPDQNHTMASDALVAAVDGYVTRGGQAMLVFDFGALTSNGAYSVPKSRFSALAGVDYLLYDELLDRTVGLGPITGFQSQLRTISVPPGKSMPFALPTAPVMPLMAHASASASVSPGFSRHDVSAVELLHNPDSAQHNARHIGVLRHANLAPGEALYLPVSPKNPGGLRGHPHAQQLMRNPFDKHRVVMTPTGPAASKIRVVPLSANPAEGAAVPRLQFANASKLQVVPHTTKLIPALSQQSGHQLSYRPNHSIAGSSTPVASLNAVNPLEAISGYIYGALTYPTYVTRGAYAGNQLLNAPQFGVAAGVNAVGAGKVLFVNLPLTYLKASTDGMLMQGFLHYFSANMLALPRLATVPNGVGGLTLNWHLCSNFTASMDQLIAQGVFSNGPFSVHITAGPDTVTPGDGLGWDLPHNLQAQQMLRNLDIAKHQIGNHGGWIHDYFGENVSESNQAQFQPDLLLNKNAVEAAIGHATTEYAAPQGNNPTWSMAWQEQHGDVGTYFLGHTGMGPTRNYLAGGISNPAIWVMPVMPMGLYATFEEFISYNVPKQQVNDWYREMVDFGVNNRTNRLIYMHPPGAADWSDVVLNLMAYAKSKSVTGNFAWYTIADMAKFMNARNKVLWSKTVAANGTWQFHATHPNTLSTMTWLVPKATFTQPVITSGVGVVADGGNDWLVKAGSGKVFNFSAAPI